MTDYDPLDRRDTDPSSGSMKAPADRAPTDPSVAPAVTLARAPTISGRKKPASPTGPRGVKDEHAGKTFGGKYRIERLVAKGGMGRVYLATQFPLERPVAIKILNQEFQQSDPTFVKRFFLEASIAAQLSHPHTITVFDYGESDDGDLYIAMEYLKGRPLSRILRHDGPYPPTEVLRLAMQVCRALRAAHNEGIIHRDLKPGNIFILDDGSDEGQGYAKVLDFGLVKLFTPENDDGNAFGASMLGDGDGELTRTGTLLGSPKYMSPEQIQGLPLDPRTDIYSFGIILFQMVSGKAPFTGATGVDVIYKHVNFPVPPVRTVNPDADCPPELEAIIRKCLEKRREDRYASMDALLNALKEGQKLLTGASIGGESLSDASRKGASSSLSASKSASKSKSRSAPRAEASFREPLADEPTPPGVLSPSEPISGGARQTTVLPLAIAGTGFLVVMATLVYVMGWIPLNPPPEKLVVGGEPAKTAEPLAKPTPKPPPVGPTVPAPPPQVEVPPPAADPMIETPSSDVQPKKIAEPTKKKARRTKKKLKRPKKPTKATEGDEPKHPKPDDVELPPNYRENPY